MQFDSFIPICGKTLARNRPEIGRNRHTRSMFTVRWTGVMLSLTAYKSWYGDFTRYMHFYIYWINDVSNGKMPYNLKNKLLQLMWWWWWEKSQALIKPEYFINRAKHFVGFVVVSMGNYQKLFFEIGLRTFRFLFMGNALWVLW